MAIANVHGLATFIPVFVIAAASPGPAIAAIVARVLGRGSSGIAYFITGLVVGDVVWLGLAVFGLAALAATMQPAILALKYGGAAYLLYMAWRMWVSPVAGSDSANNSRADATEEGTSQAAPSARGSLVFGGIALSLGNPKTMLFYIALLPNLIDLSVEPITNFLEFAAVIVLLLPAILGAYALAAARARRLLRSARAMRLVNRGVGGVLAGAAVAVATR